MLLLVAGLTLVLRQVNSVAYFGLLGFICGLMRLHLCLLWVGVSDALDGT